MLRVCGQAVHKLWKSYGWLPSLTTHSTTKRFFVVNETVDTRFLATCSKQLFGSFAQPFLVCFTNIKLPFYTFPTGLINTNKLIKE